MKRQIKFRAPIPKDSIAHVIMPDFCQDGCFYQRDQYLESFIRRANQFNYGGSGHSSYGTAELQQFTGLVDINGREIYEGDILKVGQKDNGQWLYPMQVMYCELWCQFVLDNPPAKEQYGIWTDFDEFEVIGNIYENPELLNP